MLFSERYKDKIECGNGQPSDFFFEDVKYDVKCKISDVMHQFAEPTIIRPNRYNDFEIKTDAFIVAIETFNEKIGKELISIDVFGDCSYDMGCLTTPYLFDIIELQYNELSCGEQSAFQQEIDKVFQDNDLPWILHNGRMVKIDSCQFEIDLKNKALSLMKELKDVEPVFQSAYTELTNAIESFDMDDYQSAISNAGKSYESVLKVVLGVDRGNADKLTNQYMDQLLSVPDTMAKSGFREKVLMSLPYVRNNSGSDHGAGAKTAVISKPMANLAVNLACALNTYLIEEYTERISR